MLLKNIHKEYTEKMILFFYQKRGSAFLISKIHYNQTGKRKKEKLAAKEKKNQAPQFLHIGQNPQLRIYRPVKLEMLGRRFGSSLDEGSVDGNSPALVQPEISKKPVNKALTRLLVNPVVNRNLKGLSIGLLTD